ncbi:helix-turn-helix transcriptional regulator [Pararhodospirillum oryzae]|uniref:HTH luxR-type domain-containing protein n=1 Tax=Pararhodospirillum oryzae TaxID=478448 RepID=A0A512H6Q2_9PROT|nr:hypothetical protein [Pararhodospirillum oryzae]GEO81146.1 hypothetical protein ROR02_12770 [Pararhodospirillum oryzae]
MGQIDQFEHAFEALVGAFGAAFYLIDPRRTVLVRNDAARALDQAGGALAVDAQGVLIARTARGDQLLAESVDRIVYLGAEHPTRNHALSLTIGRDDADRGTVVHILGLAGLAERAIIKVPRVMVASEGNSLPEVLRLIYGLTRAESRLAAAMLGGQTSGADLAVGLGRSEWTVRTQIRSLLAKLGVATKTEAIARMSAEVLPMDLDAFIEPRRSDRQRQGSSSPPPRAKASRAP